MYSLLRIIGLYALFPCFILAQSSPSITVTASRTEQAPKIDGRIDDSVWQNAAVFSDYIQQKPDEGKATSERTEARMLFDNNALYVAIICYDREPSKIAKRLARRDEFVEADFANILIDSYLDKKTAFGFGLNAAGVKYDFLIQNDSEENFDMNWDAIWDGATVQRADGWSAEFRIPFRVLRFAPASEQTFGVLLGRYISRKAEMSHSTPIPRTATGFVSLFGQLKGIQQITPKKALTVTPYALGGVTRFPSDQEPAWLNTYTPERRIGLDAQYGISNNTILTMTINPDFGQVEADQSKLNLTAFESFFPEKRPFFLEGTDIFRTVGALGGEEDDGPRTEMFYTRRIGRKPNGFEDLPSTFDEKTGRIVQNPTSTPILGAAKLSGKTNRGFSYGIMNAITPQTFKVVQDAQGKREKMQTEPFTNFSVLRVQQPLSGAGSYIGGIATSTIRNDATLRDAYSGALDFRYNTDNYSLSTEGLLATTRHITPLATGAEAVQGMQFQWRIGSYNHEHFQYQFGIQGTTEGFDANDLGFSQGENDGFAFIWMQYRDMKPKGKRETFQVDFATWHSRILNPSKFFQQGININPKIQWKNQWFTGGGIQINLQGFDPYESRDNGDYQAPNDISTWLFITTDQRKKISFGFNPRLKYDAFGGKSWNLGGGIQFNLGDRTQLELKPNLSRATAETGWAENVTKNGKEYAVFGKRNVDFASLTLRGGHTFSPNMTLQLYSQYFWARGQYKQFQGLESDGTLGALPFIYNGNPNFNDSDLNFNAVFRYEYRPGSTAFLVWSQGRNVFEEDATLNGNQVLQNTFQAEGTNIILLKLSYAFGL